jgi:putative membrane protein
MGTADVVPGVSGGTVALVLGIYERLLANVRAGAAVLSAALRGRLGEAWSRAGRIEWVWLVSLVAGIGLAVVTLAHTIEVLLEEQPVRMAALFFGLVGGSVVVATRLLRRPVPAHGAAAALVGVAAFWLLGLRSGPVDDPSLLVYLGAGAVAICAMILPGVSGSFLLLMLGMYDNVLGAVTDRDVAVLGVFLVGCVVGLAAFSTLLHWLLARWHDLVMAALIGLMLGSLRVLWPWPEGTEGTSMTWPEGDVLVPVLIALAGFGAVTAISGLADRADEATRTRTRGRARARR